MPDERTPLLTEAGDHGPAASALSLTLLPPASELLDWIRQSGPDSSSPPTTDPAAQLAVYLYALHLCSSAPSDGPRCIRARIAESEARITVQTWLCNTIEKFLDRGARLVDHLEEVPGSSDGEIEVEVEVMIWRKWPITDNGIKVSIVDLLLPPYTPSGTPSPFLIHPLVRHSIEHTWTHGLPDLSQDERGPSSSLKRLTDTLENYITPRRLYILDVVSRIVLIALTLALGISPRGRISPPEYQSQGFTPLEVVYSVWAIASFLQNLRFPSRLLILVPSFFVPILAISDPGASFTCLTLSIPFLTIPLISTIYPSLIYLSTSLIPLSALLDHIVLRGLRAAGLVLPLVVILFVVFAWSMNGDIFRGFYTIRAQTYAGSPPIEPGIAPFDTQLWLFVTIGLLFLLGMLLTAARSSTPGNSPSAGRRWQGGINEDDDWEREYGLVVSRQARELFTTAVRDGLESERIVVPLNLALIPLDILITLQAIWAKPRERAAETRNGSLRRVRRALWTLLMGPSCGVMGLGDIFRSRS